jgi:hypothetical protein
MNQEEVKSLVTFCKLCDRLAISAFGRQFKVAFCKAYRVQSDTHYATRVKFFNKDAFHAFLIDFRKLILEKESSNLYRVLKILGRYGNAVDRQRVKQIKNELHNIGQSAAGVGCGIVDESGNYRFARPKEMAIAYFNGVLFHSDEALANDFRFFEETGGFASHALLHYVIFIHKQALRLAGSIRLRGIV